MVIMIKSLKKYIFEPYNIVVLYNTVACFMNLISLLFFILLTHLFYGVNNLYFFVIYRSKVVIERYIVET